MSLSPFASELAAELGVPRAHFDGVVFDCDGTLADTMPIHYSAWLEALRGEGFTAEFPESQFYGFGGVPTRVIIESLNRQHGTRLDVERVFHRKEEAFLRLSTEIAPVKAVAEFARLCSGRVPIAVASGGPRPVVESTLERVGLAGIFNAVVTQDDVVRGKPAPDIFIEAARRLGVRPERCLAFEDALPGRDAAEAAGMRCILVGRIAG